MKTYNGIAKDLRTLKEKKRDFQAKETLVSSSLTFRKVENVNEIKNGFLRNQNGSGSCVSQALSKAIEMNMIKNGFNKKDIKKVVSATYFYQNRSNKPLAGSSPIEMCNFARKNNWYYEKDVPSQLLNDSQIDSLVIAQNILKESGYELFFFVDNTPTFEETAQYIELAGNAMILVDTNYTSWCKDRPSASKGGGVRHEVCAVDDVNIKGEDLIYIDESWGQYSTSIMGERGQRELTKRTFNTIVEQVIYINIMKKSDCKVNYIEYIDIPTLQFKQKHLQVKKLQEMLKKAGYFPSDVECTDYYGTITCYAVLKWQLANLDISSETLKELGGKYWGVASKTKVKQLSNLINGEINNMKLNKIEFRIDKFLSVSLSALLIYLSINLGNIEWTEAGVVAASTACLQFIFQAVVKALDLKV